jgi:arginyl-tRNA synthetase
MIHDRRQRAAICVSTPRLSGIDTEPEDPATTMSITERLGEGVRTALAKAGLPDASEWAWDIPRQAEHGDYATNAAMVLAKMARRPPRQLAELIVRNFPPFPEVARLEVGGPGFVNVFLAPAWCASALRDLLAAGDAYGRGDEARGRRIRLEFVSANPTGPLVVVNARAAAIGDALARLLRAQGATVVTEYYVNDAGSQFEALARSLEARLHQALGEDAALPENGYPGQYVVDLARDYLEVEPEGARVLELADADRLRRLGDYAVRRLLDSQREVLHAYGVDFDVWTSEQRHVRDAGLPAKAVEELGRRGLTYEAEGALWFRATAFGDEKDRVLRKSSGELTYFAVDLAYHHYAKFGGVDRVVDLLGPDHHGYVPRMRAAMRALGHPPEALDVLIVQLVTLLRDGEPVRMSKRRGEFVFMEELLEEVGRDAARFTFLTRRHDSPLEFDLGLATRQTADNPVYYVQYAHARIRSIWRQVAEQGIGVPPWSEVDLAPLTLPEEQTLLKRLLQFPDVAAAAARALEPHRVAYSLQELAGVFHPYYRAHRVIQDDRPTMLARLALCTGVGQVIENGLALLGVSAPESM